jgi:hypothetical protein
MHLIIILGVLAAALLWTSDSIALGQKRPTSLPILDFSCYPSHSVAFTTLQSTGSELGIGGDNYGKPLYRFTTISNSTLRVVEFPEFDSMRKQYEKTIAELRFDNAGSDYIFGWADNEAMGLRILMINQRDRLVSVLEVPPGSQTIPFGTSQVLKCIDVSNTASPPQREESASWSERAEAGSPILHIWRASKAAFPERLQMRTHGSVSPHSSSPAMAFKASR